MTISNDDLRRYLDAMCTKRGVRSYFDRFEQDSVISDGLKLQLEIIEVGKGKPTVVFIPGTNAYALLYGELLVALADSGFNIVGFDPRGHGRSQGARGSATIAELMRDMSAVVRYARSRFGDPIAIAGSSQGGIVSFYLAAFEEKIACAICHNLADLGDPQSVKLTRTPQLSKMMKPAIRLLARILPEMKVPISLYLNLAAEKIRGLGTAKELFHNDPLMTPSIRLKGMASLVSQKLTRPVENITTPVLIVHGGADSIFPQDYVEYIYERLTCTKSLKVYPGLPHFLILDNIATILPDIVDWIQRNCECAAA